MDSRQSGHGLKVMDDHSSVFVGSIDQDAIVKDYKQWVCKLIMMIILKMKLQHMEQLRIMMSMTTSQHISVLKHLHLYYLIPTLHASHPLSLNRGRATIHPCNVDV